MASKKKKKKKRRKKKKDEEKEITIETEVDIDGSISINLDFGVAQVELTQDSIGIGKEWGFELFGQEASADAQLTLSREGLSANAGLNVGGIVGAEIQIDDDCYGALHLSAANGLISHSIPFEVPGCKQEEPEEPELEPENFYDDGRDSFEDPGPGDGERDLTGLPLGQTIYLKYLRIPLFTSRFSTKTNKWEAEATPSPSQHGLIRRDDRTFPIVGRECDGTFFLAISKIVYVQQIKTRPRYKINSISKDFPIFRFGDLWWLSKIHRGGYAYAFPHWSISTVFEHRKQLNEKGIASGLSATHYNPPDVERDKYYRTSGHYMKYKVFISLDDHINVIQKYCPLPPKPPKPSGLPMKKKDCCKGLKRLLKANNKLIKENQELIEEIHEVLNPEDIKETEIPKRFQFPGAKGKIQIKDYPGLFKVLLLQGDKESFIPFSAKILDTAPAQKGNQTEEIHCYNQSQVLKLILEAVKENSGDIDAIKAIGVRLGYEVSLIHKISAQASITLFNIQRYLGYGLQQQIKKIKLSFNPHAGTGNGKKKKINSNKEEDINALLPELLQHHEEEMVVQAFREQDFPGRLQKRLPQEIAEIKNATRARGKPDRLA